METRIKILEARTKILEDLVRSAQSRECAVNQELGKLRGCFESMRSMMALEVECPLKHQAIQAAEIILAGEVAALGVTTASRLSRKTIETVKATLVEIDRIKNHE